MPDKEQEKHQHVEFLENEMTSLSVENASLKERAEVAEEKLEELQEKLEELEDERDDLEEEVLEYESPSSRQPPPHFKMPDERPAITHKFHIGSELGHGYLTIGTYPESRDVGEIFVTMRKSSSEEEDPPMHLRNESYVAELHRQVSELSSFLRGMIDQLAIAVSIGLQRGIPLETYARKYKGTNFPPYGMTRNKDIPHAKSIVDYIFRYLGMKYIGTDEWTPMR